MATAPHSPPKAHELETRPAPKAAPAEETIAEEQRRRSDEYVANLSAQSEAASRAKK
jgi:hypothetical protein